MFGKMYIQEVTKVLKQYVSGLKKKYRSLTHLTEARDCENRKIKSKL